MNCRFLSDEESESSAPSVDDDELSSVLPDRPLPFLAPIL
jgi:hypothetical protein